MVFHYCHDNDILSFSNFDQEISASPFSIEFNASMMSFALCENCFNATRHSIQAQTFSLDIPQEDGSSSMVSMSNPSVNVFTLPMTMTTSGKRLTSFQDERLYSIYLVSMILVNIFERISIMLESLMISY